MSDFLLNLANAKLTAQLVKTLGLPALARLRRGGTEAAAPLSGALFLVGSLPGDYADQAVAAALMSLGAKMIRTLPEGDSRLGGVVLDATGCRSADDLHGQYGAFHPLMRRLERCARMVVLAGVPAEQDDPMGWMSRMPRANWSISWTTSSAVSTS
jgi:3-oxoacyl-[acyl-carrier protein] reductase